MLTVSEARRIHWCLESTDAVHEANWTPDGGGWLTTLHEDADGNITLSLQQGATISELRDGLVKPWRDRKLFGAPVCEQCEADVEFDEFIADWAEESHHHDKGQVSE